MLNQITRTRWTRFNDFSIHFGNGVTLINPHFRREHRQADVSEMFNPYQYFLYRRCLFGTDVYSKEELDHMHKQKIKRIEMVHKRALEVLNLYRQEAMIEITNKFLLRCAPKICGNLLSGPLNCTPDPEWKCEISYEDLGITRKMIAWELVERKCLPQRFFQLSVKDDPRLIRLTHEVEPLEQL